MAFLLSALFYDLKRTFFIIMLVLFGQLYYTLVISGFQMHALLVMGIGMFLGILMIYIVGSMKNSLADMVDLLQHKNVALQLSANEAQVANNLKSEFIANISHEFRTPMHAILNFARMGMNRKDGIEGGKFALYFENIKISADRLMVLINNLLDLSQFESGTLKMRFSKNSLKDVSLMCITSQKEMLDRQKNQIEWGWRRPLVRVNSIQFVLPRLSRICLQMPSNFHR